MNLLVDIGNTRIKAALVEGSSVKEVSIIKDEQDWIEIIKKNPQNILVSSVRKDTDGLIKPLLASFPKLLILTTSLKLPIGLNYDTPDTLGMDRLAAATGAYTLAPDAPLLSVMAGTCITCDLTVKGVYQGGSISPGVRMRLDAMHHFTSKLPVLEPSEQYSFPGKSTAGSMQAGAVEGALLEIQNRILHLRKEYPDLVVFISGGDALLFESSVNPPIFVVPDLIFVGLNRILEYNV
jgi:type III pantothenate kinase